MSDLIDRQAAIDAVIKRDANCGIDSAEVLKALPSAQHEITLADVERYCTPRCLTVVTDDIFNEMKARFSAVREIIRCKDCKYQDKGRNECETWNLCGYRPWQYMPITDDHFCGYAERRTDG